MKPNHPFRPSASRSIRSSLSGLMTSYPQPSPAESALALPRTCVAVVLMCGCACAVHSADRLGHDSVYVVCPVSLLQVPHSMDNLVGKSEIDLLDGQKHAGTSAGVPHPSPMPVICPFALHEP